MENVLAQGEASKSDFYLYQKMVEEVQDYAIILLDINGIIRNWNHGAQKIKQYSEQEIVGKSFRVFYLPEDREAQLPERLLKQAFVEGRAVHEGWRVRKDQSKFWGSITLTALHDASNNVIGFTKVTRDLTERKLAEDRQMEYTETLEAKNRELEQFAYIASHDLQEPLRKIRMFASMMQKEADNKELVSEYSGKIENVVVRMSKLITAVLNYSKLSEDNDDITEIDINTVLTEVKEEFELLVREKQAVIYQDQLPMIKALPGRINQLFANLIGNALKFTTTAPVIHITTRPVDNVELKQRIPNLPDKKFIEIAIADNGIGFDQQYEDRIFTMFQRLNPTRKFSGTGIGLALCLKIMKAHHGFITATSELNKGATFRLYFPVE